MKFWLLTLTRNFEEEGGGGEGGEWGGEEKQQYKQQLQASTKLNHKLQQMADYQPGDRLKEGTQIFILLSVQPKVNHEIFFHLLDLTELNSWILLSSCGAKYTEKFQAPSSEEVDWQSWKEPRSPHPQSGCKTKCGCKKCFATRAAVCVLVTAKIKVRCINAPDVMWACLWCIVWWNITPK